MKYKHIFLLLMPIMLAGLSFSGTEYKGASIPSFDNNDFSKAQVYKVTKVIDGDTIAVQTALGDVTVRLQGVDTPETKDPRKTVQEYGQEATVFLTNLLKGEKVYLLPVGEKFHNGKYGRLIAYVFRAPDGLFVNAEIIRQGYGHAYPKYPGKYTDKFLQLERFAKNAGKGLWGRSSTQTAPDVSFESPVVKPRPSSQSTISKPATSINKDATITVYRTKTGHKYHSAGCSYLRRGCYPISLKDAKAMGLTPCSRCSPPK